MYWFYSAKDSLFVQGKVVSTVRDTGFTLRGLQAKVYYWWKVMAYNIAGWGPFSETRKFSVSMTGLDAQKEVPKEYSLSQNYSNPFNPSTTIRYGLPQRSQVTLSIFNTLGQQVALLQNGEQEVGYHEVRFEGSGLSSGVYFYRMQAGSFIETKKFLLVR
jgi:hypothetical protein